MKAIHGYGGDQEEVYIVRSTGTEGDTISSDVEWTQLGIERTVPIQSSRSKLTYGKNDCIQLDTGLGANLGDRIRGLSHHRSDGAAFPNNKIILSNPPVEKVSGGLDSLSESSVTVADIAESMFCVSSEDGQKLYQSIRSALLDGKKVLISFEGITNISSAFLDEAISNLYNGEFDEEELKQKINYRGLSQEDSSLLRNIIEWAKEDFMQPAQ